ncbi:unnamed protein product [Ophioblennius macclurei]
MQRPLSSLPLSCGVKRKLAGSGFQFAAELFRLAPQQLAREAGLTQQEALQVLQIVGAAGGGAERAGERGGACSSLTALELLQKEEELRSIVTFCSQLDVTLNGGIPIGKITEICGVPGIGKTQLCLQLAVDVQVPQCFGGVEGQVIFVDTEGTFILQRVVDIAAAVVRHCSLLAEDEEQRTAMATFTVETILSNILLVRCHDYVELLAELHLLPCLLSDRPRVRLLVIDSVAAPFRLLFDDLSLRTRLLGGISQQLITLATGHDIAVAITNQMTTRVLQGGNSQLVPALGELWGHAPTNRLFLQWAGPRRLATMLKCPAHPEATVQYQITSDGFRDANVAEQPGNKRARTDAGQSEAGVRESGS